MEPQAGVSGLLCVELEPAADRQEALAAAYASTIGGARADEQELVDGLYE